MCQLLNIVTITFSPGNWWTEFMNSDEGKLIDCYENIAVTYLLYLFIKTIWPEAKTKLFSRTRKNKGQISSPPCDGPFISPLNYNLNKMMQMSSETWFIHLCSRRLKESVWFAFLKELFWLLFCDKTWLKNVVFV